MSWAVLDHFLTNSRLILDQFLTSYSQVLGQFSAISRVTLFLGLLSKFSTTGSPISYSTSSEFDKRYFVSLRLFVLRISLRAEKPGVPRTASFRVRLRSINSTVSTRVCTIASAREYEPRRARANTGRIKEKEKEYTTGHGGGNGESNNGSAAIRPGKKKKNKQDKTKVGKKKDSVRGENGQRYAIGAGERLYAGEWSSKNLMNKLRWRRGWAHGGLRCARVREWDCATIRAGEMQRCGRNDGNTQRPSATARDQSLNRRRFGLCSCPRNPRITVRRILERGAEGVGGSSLVFAVVVLVGVIKNWKKKKWKRKN